MFQTSVLYLANYEAVEHIVVSQGAQAQVRPIQF